MSIKQSCPLDYQKFPRDKRKKKLSSVSANQHSVILPVCGKEINQSERDINKTTGQQITL